MQTEMDEYKYLSRRGFLKRSLLLGAAAYAQPWTLLANSKADEIKLTFLHTNDVHSRIEPFPMDGSRLQGLGGVARRATLLQAIRKEEDHVLLFDAGDMFQGTPYFNLFDGQIELELMTKLGYDAGTFGNHEFDNGIPGLLKHFDKAHFPFLTSNYDFSNTPLAGKTKAYTVFEKGGIKVGVFGLGINLEGLVDPKNHQDMVYHDPIKTANNVVSHLKQTLGCHVVICLSHIGYSYQTNQVSDLVLATQTSDIDIIIGGHTHTFLDRPTEVRNRGGKLTLVNQTGRSGVNLGRIDLFVNPETQAKRYLSQVYQIDRRFDHTTPSPLA